MPINYLKTEDRVEKMSRAKERLFETVDRIWKQNKKVSEKQVQRDIADAVQAIR